MNDPGNINDKNRPRQMKAQYGNKMPYEVPEHYFDELPGKLMDTVRAHSAVKVHMRARLRKIIAAAALIIAAALVLTAVFTGRPSAEPAVDEYSMFDIYEFNFNNLADMEEAYLMSLIGTDSLVFDGLMVSDTAAISDEAIIDYLLAENHVEYNILYY
jgi:hypothetical protein